MTYFLLFLKNICYIFYSFFFCVDILNPSVGNEIWVSITCEVVSFEGNF